MILSPRLNQSEKLRRYTSLRPLQSGDVALIEYSCPPALPPSGPIGLCHFVWYDDVVVDCLQMVRFLDLPTVMSDKLTIIRHG